MMSIRDADCSFKPPTWSLVVNDTKVSIYSAFECLIMVLTLLN